MCVLATKGSSAVAFIALVSTNINHNINDVEIFVYEAHSAIICAGDMNVRAKLPLIAILVLGFNAKNLDEGHFTMYQDDGTTTSTSSTKRRKSV